LPFDAQIAMTIACVDVAYRERKAARAACVVIDAWESSAPLTWYAKAIDVIPHAYEPGFFYRRELPYLMTVLRLLPALPAVIVVDGYVWLPDGRPGLGVYLYEALVRCAAVVGIAKRPFEGVGASDCVLPVLRGASRQPLFVTAQGMANAVAAMAVRTMAGKHRIPDMVRMADRLSREDT